MGQFATQMMRLLIAFAAGFASLLIQTTSLRLAIQEIGGNRFTAAAILATALLGLAVGAIGFGKLADKHNLSGKLAPLLLGIVGVIMIAFGYLARTFASSVATTFTSVDGGVGLAPLIFASIVSLPLHAIIGGIIPSLLVLHPKENASAFAEIRSSLAWLYALETAGAAIGALVTVFLLIPTLGIHFALFACGATGCLISVAAICFSSDIAVPSSEIEREIEIESIEPPVPQRGSVSGLSLAILLCSSASLGMELIWQRFFVFVLGSDSRSYAVVVAVTLIGFSFGSWLSGMKRIRASSVFAYSLSLLAISAAFAISMMVLRQGMRVEVIQASLNWLLAAPFFARAILSMAVILFPAICIGFAFPLVSDLWVERNRRVGARIGRLYALVAFANVVGVFGCASVLIPQIGLYRCAIVLSAFPFVAGIAIMVMNWKRQPRRSIARVLTISVGGLACGGLLLTLSLGHPIRAGLVENAGWKEIFYREDSVQTVAVVESNSNPNRRRMMIDGVTIGESESGVDEKQRMLAHLPFLIGSDRQHKNVYTIGLGTGILASELSQQPSVDSVVVTELSEGVITALDFFSETNGQLSANDKVKIINDDGIRFLRRSPSRYDVIVSDGKSRPGAAANISFFSREYYQLCADRLAENGVFVQWVSIRCDRQELAVILKTFADSFPFGRVGFATPGSIYLVGSDAEFDFDSQKMNDHLQQASAASLRSYGWASADDILSMYWLDQRALESDFVEDAAINTFDRPVLELYAWDSFRYSVQSLSPQISLLEDLVVDDVDDDIKDDTLAVGRKAAKEILAANKLTLAAEPDWLDRAASHWKKALTFLPELNRQQEIAKIYRELAIQHADRNEIAIEYSALLNLIELNRGTAKDRLRVALILESYNAFADALPHHYAAVKQANNKAAFRVAFAECLMMLRKYRRANQQLAIVLEDSTADLRLMEKAKFLRDISSIKSGDSNPDLLSKVTRAALLSPESSVLLRKFQIPIFDWQR